MHVNDYRAGFYAIVQTNIDFYDTEIRSKQHETFTREGINYYIHSPFEMFSSDSAIHRTIVNHSISVYLNPEMTEIDEALKRYKLKRFVFFES
jgi:hypothetical protein